MYVCLVCNGMEVIKRNCTHCDNKMVDEGRVINQFDDYAPYMDDETTKLVDGDIYSKHKHLCLHLLKCSTCDYYLQAAVEEKYIT
ncbi:hypothetical protein [Paraliobacillus sp. JSM ZJ581]|uniref:hypothetical protein n=1 Tax=Paraliobacillus sp. JSM ZJ581 TaxID=3342118 RepID=UPI0035A8A5A3